MLGLPFNPGCINRNHTHGTHAPVEEPSTASKADIGYVEAGISRRQCPQFLVRNPLNLFLWQARVE
jgi:hypothetical protein